MRTAIAAVIICFSCYFYSPHGYAQSTQSFSLVKDDISTMIPSLSVLIDSAIANNPGLKSGDMQILINKYTLQSNRDYWTRNLGLAADVRYGNFNSYASSNGTDVTVASSRSELRYGVGGTIKFPIYDFLDRRNQLKLAKTQINLTECLVEEKKIELRKVVIKQYNDLLLKQRLIKLSAKNIETIKINMIMAEKGFLNGAIPLSEYSRISDIVNKAQSDFENLRTEFLTTYMILEEIVGMKFNLNNAIMQTNEGN